MPIVIELSPRQLCSEAGLLLIRQFDQRSCCHYFRTAETAIQHLVTLFE
jgi:hypothetical protein